jgi:hypothetical protein
VLLRDSNNGISVKKGRIDGVKIFGVEEENEDVSESSRTTRNFNQRQWGHLEV